MAENLNEQVGVATPVETTTARGLFDFKHKDEDGKPIKEETLASEFDQKVQVSDPVEAESKDEQENKHDGIVEIPRSYSRSSSSCSDEEGDDEEKKQRKKEKKGLKEKLMDKLPGHKDEVVDDTHVPIEEPHVQEVVYSEPPHTEEDPEKKGQFLDKIKEKLPAGQNKSDDHHADEAVPVVAEPAVKGKEDKKGLLDKINEKLPGQNKTDDHHDEAVPVVTEPTVEGEEDKKGFLDKIKDKIPGLSRSKASDEKNDHEDK